MIDNFVIRGRQLPVHLDRLSEMESQAVAGHEWLDLAAKQFLINKSPCSLLQVSMLPPF